MSRGEAVLHSQLSSRLRFKALVNRGIGVCSSVRRAHVGRRYVSSVVGARAIHRHEGIVRNGVFRCRCAEVIGTQRLLQHDRMPCLACIGRV